MRSWNRRARRWNSRSPTPTESSWAKIQRSLSLLRFYKVLKTPRQYRKILSARVKEPRTSLSLSLSLSLGDTYTNSAGLRSGLEGLSSSSAQEVDALRARSRELEHRATALEQELCAEKSERAAESQRASKTHAALETKYESFVKSASDEMFRPQRPELEASKFSKSLPLGV